MNNCGMRSDGDDGIAGPPSKRVSQERIIVNRRLLRHIALTKTSFSLVLLVTFSFVLQIGTGCRGLFARTSADERARNTYVAEGPPQITLFTFVYEPIDFHWHSGLMISAGERILYDPAALWNDRPRRRHRDVRYGFCDERLANYMQRVVGRSRHVIIQSVEVPAEVAQAALEIAVSRQPRIYGTCASSITTLLRELPGFEDIPRVVFPVNLMEAFADIPGVRTTRFPLPDEE